MFMGRFHYFSLRLFTFGNSFFYLCTDILYVLIDVVSLILSPHCTVPLQDSILDTDSSFIIIY